MKFLAFTAVALLTDYLALSFQEPSAILQTPQYASKKSLGRCFMSVPNAIDTLTSGLASIVRVDDKGLAGVTIVDNLNSNDDIRLLKLFDVENSNDCRLVRETVTELDLVVEKMIPAAPKSRALIDSSYPDGLPQGQEVPCLVASLTSGDEIVISGASALVKFLKGTFSNESIAVSSGEEKEPLQKVIQAITPLSLLVTSLLRVGRGSNLSPAANEAKRPELPLIMYSYEGNQFCRLVREVLTELDIVYELRSAGKGSTRRDELSEVTGGSSQCPYLIDPNTNVAMAESADIIRYLYQTYALWTPPNELLEWTSQNVMSLAKPIFSFLTPLQAGSSDEDESYVSSLATAKKEIEAETSANPIVVYTYDLSPFSSETKGLLKNLNLPYENISLGKEWIPGLLSNASKRAALLEMTGQSSLPHVFVGGKPIGGLFSGNPGILSLLKEKKFISMCQKAIDDSKK